MIIIVFEYLRFIFRCVTFGGVVVNACFRGLTVTNIRRDGGFGGWWVYTLQTTALNFFKII